MNQIETALNLNNQAKGWWNELQKTSGLGTAEARTRKSAFSRFQEQGFPTTRQEDWKYTDVHRILDIPYAWPVKDEQELSAEIFSRLPLSPLTGEDGYHMVFVNGYFMPDYSTLPAEKAKGITLKPLRKASGEKAWQTHLATVAETATGFISLNTALHTDGAFLHLEAGATLDKPLFLWFVAQCEQDAYFIQPRNLIVAEAGASANIVELFVSAGEEPSLTNVVTEIVAGEQAKVDYTKLQLETHQNYHVGTAHVSQEQGSRVDTHLISLDGAFIRNNLNFSMKGKSCSSILNGLYLLHDEQFLDNHTRVDHARPECFSDQLYKGIMDDKSTGVFNGKIYVHPDAQQTNAYQRNVNILLSDDAAINTKPQLEIYADDVRCTHGATTGYLNEEAIFYLRSRGIGEEEARLLMMNAFAGEIVEKLNIAALKEPLTRLIADKLRNRQELAG
ncbi:Fe-S cluster assembly protein SufD [Compostibacter hankyongensis]|uniref:Fe-S cluster assembly protein SufD n=1 Tax=Compostibacter hankyongensis TaxID=1007089 RepID=A0ABP8FL21_9BACT